MAPEVSGLTLKSSAITWRRYTSNLDLISINPIFPRSSNKSIPNFLLPIARFSACNFFLLHPAQKFVRLRQAMRKAAGVGAVAAPVGQFLKTHGLVAARGILPGEARLGFEGGEIRQLGTAVLLQPYAAAARHFRHLIDREDHHLVVGTDHGNGVAGDGGDGAGLVRHFDVEHLLALAGVADAIVLVDHKTLPFEARDQELAAALVDEQRDDRGILLHVDEHPDRLAMAASARQFCDIERIEFSVGGRSEE